MDRDQRDKVFAAMMVAKVFIEDAIALERSGQPSGFKAGALKRSLHELDTGISIIATQEDQ